MDIVLSIAGALFYGASIVAAIFFTHKVFWLVQYRRIQRAIVDDGIRLLREGNEAGQKAWEEHARTAWSNALGAEINGPSTFIRRVEEGLDRVRRDLRKDRGSIEEYLGKALSGRASPGSSIDVLYVRRLTKRGDKEAFVVSLDVEPVSLPAPRPPPARLYELSVRSRYGLLRRALVFFSGAADVVYSAQHVALMSQNPHLPTSVLVRRLSLALLVVAVVAIDLIFGARAAITALIQGYLFPLTLRGSHAPPAPPPGFWEEHLATGLGFVTWLAAYGSIYLVLFFSVRRRYQVNMRRLRALREGERDAIEGIQKRHVRELAAWGREYGESLDNAVTIARRHAETLVDHVGHELRRRIAGPTLLEPAKSIADGLFLKLPESRGELADAATTHKHSFWHYVWPRPEEMEYQRRLAQYRAAWQYLELAVGDLRREQPDPNQAHALWRSATLYAQAFAPILPSGLADELERAYGQMVVECVAETDKALADLDKRLAELARSLEEQLESAKPLLASRVELARDRIEGSMAAHVAEIIRVREQARLEAMAFEI